MLLTLDIDTYRAIIQDLTEAIVILNETGHITAYNTTGSLHFFGGRKPKDIYGTHIRENQPLSSLETDLTTFASSEATERTIEIPLSTYDNRKYFSVTFRKIPETPSRPRKLIVISFDDITAEKNLVEALERAKERYQSAFEEAVIGMALIGPDGHFLRVNRVFTQITGYSADELHLTTVGDITYPEDRGAEQDLFAELLAGLRETYETRKRFLHKDGHLIWAVVNASLVLDQSGNPAYIIDQVRDITEKERVEERLRLSEEESRTLVESSSDPIFMIGPDRTVWACNQAFLDYFGFTRNEIIGQSTRLIHPDDESFRLFSERAYPTVDAGGTFRTEWNLMTKNGNIRLVESVLSSIRGDSGEIRGYVSIIRDMTGRKTTENELRERMADLQRLNRFMVDRELKMVELKRRIKELERLVEENR